MTQPPLVGICGTVRAIAHIRVPLGSCGQVRLHLKYDALQLGLHRVGVAAMFCGSPGDDGAVLLHGGKSTHASNDVANTTVS